MSGRAYRQHALAEMSNSATFDYRSATYAWNLCQAFLLVACTLRVLNPHPKFLLELQYSPLKAMYMLQQCSNAGTSMCKPTILGPCIDCGRLNSVKTCCHGTQAWQHLYRGGKAAHWQASMEADILEEADEQDADAPSLGGSLHMLQCPSGCTNSTDKLFFGSAIS